MSRQIYSKRFVLSYENDLSVITIKKTVLPDSLSFDLSPASQEFKQLNNIRSMQTKQQGLMEYRLNVLNFLSMLLTNVLLVSQYFSDGAKNALVRPIHKNKGRQDKGNYRPVSILNGFSKAYEKFINDSTLPIIQTYLSNFVSDYRKQCIANYVLKVLQSTGKRTSTITKQCCFHEYIKSF